MRVAIIERDEKVLEELKKGLKRVDPNYELAGIAGISVHPQIDCLLCLLKIFILCYNNHTELTSFRA